MIEPIPHSFTGVANVGDEPQHISIPLKDEALVSRAKPRRRPDQSVQYRRKIERRSADDLQHLRGRCLLLQGLGQVGRAVAEVGGALPQFVQQPRILDRNHCLIRERRHQIDLTLRERFHSGTRESDDADRFALTHKRHSNHRTTAGNFNCRFCSSSGSVQASSI
jgi:hypothetical protein